MDAKPIYIGASFQLSLLPRRTLLVLKPQTRQDCRFKNHKSLQQYHIFGCLAKWRVVGGLAKLVECVLGDYEQFGVSYGGNYFEDKNKRRVIISNNTYVWLQMDTLQRL